MPVIENGEESVGEAAARLLGAYSSRVPTAPVRELIGSTAIDVAYRVQQCVIAARLRAGSTIVGRKIGLTSEAVQRQVGVDQPDFGVLLDDMRFADGEVIPFSTLLQPGAFVLGGAEVRLADFEPRDVTMTLVRDGAEVSSGTGAACLGDPLAALAWLARTAARYGEPLRAGDIVLSGALGPLVPVAPGQVLTATISSLGTVTARFGEGEPT